jgi:predicted RNA-binding Zn-ribbon protein involved in translation (DUF1610 family)
VADEAKFCPSCGKTIVVYPTSTPSQPPPSYGAAAQPVAAAGPGNERSKLYVIPLVFSFLGALLLVFDDFGGWYSSTGTGYGGYIREWGWINAWGFAAVVIIPLAVALFYCSFISLQGLRSSVPIAKKHVRRGFFVALLVLVVVVVGGLALIAATWEAAENWLDLGFYGGFFGSLITAIFFGVELRKMDQPSYQGPSAPAYAQAPAQTYQTYPQTEAQAPAQYQQPPQYQPQPAPAPQYVAQAPQCPSCGATVQQGAKFCPSCGAQIV